MPAGEEASASGGENDCAARAFWQCRRFIDLLRRRIGLEPGGATLRIARSGQEVDQYIEVVVEYDDEDPAARAYAIRCDREAPTQWDHGVSSTATRT